MAVIYRTTLKPTKLELLTAWLPSRPWYRGGAGGPELAKAGGFRLDDPDGEVGVEFIIVTDTADTAPTTYLVPLTYRGAPLDGAQDALVGTMEHGVLGRRWVYDAPHDPVFAAQLPALIDGRVLAQAQSVTDAPAPEVVGSYTGEGTLAADLTGTVSDDRDGTDLPAPRGTTLRLHRVLRPAPTATPPAPQTPAGRVTGPWTLPDGTSAQGDFAVLRTAPGAPAS